jgi:hypothetical protein
MKVSMKKLEPKKSEESNLKSVKTVTSVKQPEVDLFSFESDPQTVSSTKSSSSSAAAVFDPFGQTQVAAPPVPPAPPSFFDPFSSAPAPVVSTPAPMNQGFGFDPFSSNNIVPPPVPVQPAINQLFYPLNSTLQPSLQQASANINGFQTFNSPPSNAGFMNTSAPTVPFQQAISYAPSPNIQSQFSSFSQSNNLTPNSTSMPIAQSLSPRQQPSMNSFVSAQPPPAPPVLSPSEFGDFESHNSVSSAPPAVDKSKWGDLGKLVDLSSISANPDKNAKPSNTSYSQNSFAGLDGFSRPQPSMSNGGVMNQTTSPQPPAMLVRQPAHFSTGEQSFRISSVV